MAEQDTSHSIIYKKHSEHVKEEAAIKEGALEHYLRPAVVIEEEEEEQEDNNNMESASQDENDQPVIFAKPVKPKKKSGQLGVEKKKRSAVWSHFTKAGWTFNCYFHFLRCGRC